MINALALYGSRARGDERPDSDTDLLGITGSSRILPPSYASKTSLHLYPLKWMQEQSANGNLFVYHVIFEGRPLFDPEDIFPRLRFSFTLKKTYYKEIREASLILSYIANAPYKASSGEFLKRYFWAIRTILVSSSANMGNPIFGIKQLENYSKIDGLSHHLSHRETLSVKDIEKYASMILDDFGNIEVAAMPHNELIQELKTTSSIGRRMLSKPAITTDIGGLGFYE